MQNHKGYDGKTFRLADGEGNYLQVGDTVTTSRRDVEGTIQHIHAPHKASSCGFITSTVGYYYASVFGLHFEEVARTADELKVEAKLQKLIPIAEGVFAHANEQYREGNEIWSVICECRTVREIAESWIDIKYSPRTVSGAIKYELKYAKICADVYADRAAEGAW